MSKTHIKIRAILIAAIAIIIAFDLMAATAIIVLDSTKAYRNITTYKNCSVTRMIKEPDRKLVAASFGYRTFLIPTKKTYKKGDKVDVNEIDVVGFFSHATLERTWEIKR